MCIRDSYNITKKEWVLDGASVLYGSASELRETLEYDFTQEKKYSYKGCLLYTSAYDMDIILGGEMGGYLSDYMIPLGEKVMKYNGFDHDLRYLKNCSYKKEASAVGAAKHFLQDFIGKI